MVLFYWAPQLCTFVHFSFYSRFVGRRIGWVSLFQQSDTIMGIFLRSMAEVDRWMDGWMDGWMDR
jgi:hypothetical protein